MAGKSTARVTVKLSANFERNLADIERFLARAEALTTFDALLDELVATVIPNLERFPDIGRPFLSHDARSVETMNALDALREKVFAVTHGDALREYVLPSYLVIYVRAGSIIHLLSIRHHKQLSFDLQRHWGET